MMKKLVLPLLLGLFMATFIPLEAKEKAKTQKTSFITWYERFPWMLEDFPYGTYQERIGCHELINNIYFQSKLSLDTLSRNNTNYLWTTGLSQVQSRIDKTGHAQAYPDKYKPELSEFGKWYYGTNCRRNEMKSMPGLANWLGTKHVNTEDVFGKQLRNFPLFTEAEKENVAKKLKSVFAYGKKLRKDYPDVVTIFVSDDEPHQAAPAVAAYDLIEERIGAPAMTCKPTFSGVKLYAPYMKAITGDWYLNYDSFSENWAMAPQLRWMHKHYPENIVWVMLWTTGSCFEWNEETLPGLRDSRGSRAELRLQMWQAVALGAKGVFSFITGGSFPGYYGGGHGLFNCMFQKDSVNGHLDEWSRMGTVLTTQGLLLLTCKLDDTYDVKVACEKVSFPEFEGPAIDHGLLKDVKHDRFYLIPWNNDILKKQTATITVPENLLKDRQLYDLNTLSPVKMRSKNSLRVTLLPGDGKILLGATPEEFGKCRQIILKKRTRTPRVVLRQKLEIANLYGADLSKAQDLLDQTTKHESERKWDQALELYGKAIHEVVIATQRVPNLYNAQQDFDRIASILSESDTMFRSYLSILGTLKDPRRKGLIFKDEIVGHIAAEWTELARNYFLLLKELYDDVPLNLSHQSSYIKRNLLRRLATISLPTLLKQSQRNQEELKTAIAQKLELNRIPAKVAFISPDRATPEYSQSFSWLYKNSHAKWFAPNKNGELVDRQDKPLNVSDFDVVWIHQLRYATMPQNSAKPDVKKVLMPQITTPKFVDSIKKVVRKDGKGLLLTGVAGLYSTLLGVETNTPDLLQENKAIPLRAVGVAPAPGYQNHPVFNGFSELGMAEGFITNGGKYSSRFAWEKIKPSGKTIATMFDGIYGQMENEAIAVECPFGKGKIAILDGYCLDLTPNFNHLIPNPATGSDRGRNSQSIKHNSRFGLRDRVRKFTLNMIEYLANDNTFQMDASAAAQLKENLRLAREKRANILELPKENWKIKTDPNKIGENEKWFAIDFDDSAWRPIKIGLNWETQGVDYDGLAWYRKKIKLKNRAGKKAIMRFDAVDEKATVFIDGKKVGESHGEWDKPFEFDITEYLTDDEQDHVIAVKVYDLMAAGGIWKPVSIIYN